VEEMDKLMIPLDPELSAVSDISEEERGILIGSGSATPQVCELSYW
jgi:hypothetical protein